MDKEKLTVFAIAEFQKTMPADEIPQEIAGDEKKISEFILSNVNGPLLDKVVDEFCQKNPEPFAVLNVFSVSDEKLKEIKENIAAAIADGTVERIKYEQVVNHAGLEYKKKEIDDAFLELSER
jgi:hypothetical protein